MNTCYEAARCMLCKKIMIITANSTCKYDIDKTLQNQIR